MQQERGQKPTQSSYIISQMRACENGWLSSIPCMIYYIISAVLGEPDVNIKLALNAFIHLFALEHMFISTNWLVKMLCAADWNGIGGDDVAVQKSTEWIIGVQANAHSCDLWNLLPLLFHKNCSFAFINMNDHERLRGYQWLLWL